MSYWTSDPPPQSRSRRLQFRDGVDAASTPFAASSIGFLPVAPARSQSRSTRPAEQQFFFRSLFRSTSAWFTSEPAAVSRWKRGPRPYNADAPIGSRITTALSSSGYAPSDSPRRPFQRSVRPIDDMVAMLPLEVFGEPVVNDMGFAPSVKPIRVGMNADVFPSLGFATTFDDSLFFGSGTTS